jgi:hypothetical protein
MDFQAKFEEWFADEGKTVEDEVGAAIQKSMPLFDSADGIHAKWVTPHEGADESLGVLLMFSHYEIADLLCAWEEAKEGDMNGGGYVASWLHTFMSFVDAACD